MLSNIVSVDFDVTDQLFRILLILELKWEKIEAVHQLVIDFEKTYHSIRIVVLHNTLIEFGIS